MYTTKRKKVILLAISIGFYFCAKVPTIWATSKEKYVAEGNDLFEKGDYTGSIEKYQHAIEEDSESDIINFNLGTGYYKNEDYVKAIDHLHKSLLTEDELLKEKTYYNLGNSFYKAGIAQEERDIPLAITALENSLTQYENSLKIDENDEDTQHNYDFVKEELERLKKKQEDQQKQQQQQQQKDQDQDQQQDKDRSQEKEQQEQQKKQGKQEQKEQKEKEEEQGQEKNEKQQEESTSEEQQQNNNKSSGDQQPSESESSDQRDPQEMTEQEAEMLLERYMRTEEPQELLNVNQRWRHKQPVIRDW